MAKRIRALLSGAILVAFATAASAQSPTLTIYTYDSFAAEWGVGPQVQTEFEERCDCAIHWVTVDSAAVLLTRLRLEGDATQADIVLGLDTSLMAEVNSTGLFAPHEVDTGTLDLPTDWTDPNFLPFDYGHFAFVYDSETLPEPPTSLAELVDGDGPKFIIQDPRTSTPGLGLMLWIRRIYGDGAGAAWAQLAPNILTVTKGWSEAYGLFLDGEAPMVLSYATSPAYHQMYDETDRYKAAIWPEGHYIQIEIAGRTRTSQHPELAREFLEFMISPDFQRHIPPLNIMRPVINLQDELPSEFQALTRPITVPPFPGDEIASHRQDWIDEWLEHASR